MSDQSETPDVEEVDAGGDDAMWAEALTKVSGEVHNPEAPEPAEPATDKTDAPEVTDDGGTEDDQPKAKETPSKPADIWADAPEPLKTAYEEAKAAREAAESNWNRHRNQINGQAKKIAELETKLRELGTSDATKETTAKASDAADAIARLKEDYPEIGEALAPIIAQFDDLRQELGAVKSTASNVVVEREADVMRAIEQEHPGFEGLIESKAEAFWSWVEDQPKKLRDIAHANTEAYVDAAGVSELLTAFKAHLNPPQQTTNRSDKRTRQLAGATAPAPRGGHVAGEAAPAGEDQLWEAAVASALKSVGRR